MVDHSCNVTSTLPPCTPIQAFNRLNRKYRGFNIGNMPWYSCGHISFRYLDGILIALDTNKINTVCFTPVSECDLVCNSTKSYKVDYNYSKKILQIFYVSNSTYKCDLSNIPELIIISGHEMELMDERLYNGCYSTYPCAICNNLMYIQGMIPISGICQYLVSSNQCETSGMLVKNTLLHILINDLDIDNYYIPYHTINDSNDDIRSTYLTNQLDQLNIDSDYNRLGIGKDTIPPTQDKNKLTSYIDFINNDSSMSLLVLPMDEDLPQLVNMYHTQFDGMPAISNDCSISGMVNEWAINDIRVFAEFIKVLKNAYPSINFYTDNEDIDQTHFNEWVNYSMQMRPNRSPLYNTHVLYNHFIGRHWYTTVDFTLEYSCNDLPTILARRDDYCAEKFFNDIKIFSIKLSRDERNPNPAYDILSTCALFWDRDTFDSNIHPTTYQDDTGYSMSSMSITGRIIYVNIQYKPRQVGLIDTVLTDIITTMNASKKVYTDKSQIVHLEYSKPIDDNEVDTEDEDNQVDESVDTDDCNSAIDYDSIISEYNKNENEYIKGLVL